MPPKTGKKVRPPAKKTPESRHNQCTPSCTISESSRRSLKDLFVGWVEHLALCPSMVEPWQELPLSEAGKYRGCRWAEQHPGFQQLCPCITCTERRLAQGWTLRSDERLYAQEPLVLLEASCACHATSKQVEVEVQTEITGDIASGAWPDQANLQAPEVVLPAVEVVEKKSEEPLVQDAESDLSEDSLPSFDVAKNYPQAKLDVASQPMHNNQKKSKSKSRKARRKKLKAHYESVQDRPLLPFTRVENPTFVPDHQSQQMEE